jgi:hypothetical protein
VKKNEAEDSHRMTRVPMLKEGLLLVGAVSVDKSYIIGLAWMP